MKNSSFAADKLRQFSGSLFLAPAFQPVFLLNSVQAIQVAEKGRNSDQNGWENSGQNVKRGEQQEGDNDAVKRPENQRAGKPFDVQPGIHFFDWIALHHTKNALITTPTRIKNRQAPNQPIIAF